MKKACKLLVFGLAAMLTLNIQAQESSWTVGADFVSNYIWRGLKFGSGPAVQPTVEFGTGGFAIGAWGNYNFTDDEVEGDAAETDLYASYSFGLGESSALSLSFTDYYFPNSDSRYFKAASHSFEPGIGLEISKFSLSAAYMMSNQTGENEDVEDFYIQAGYTIGNVDLFVGGGDGQYSLSGDFNISNFGVSTSRDIKISDTFTLPLFGSAIWNPNAEQFYLVVGFSL
ncbi:MAG: hypothetical protein AB7D05_10385 [Mangrovibacterium sp.]